MNRLQATADKIAKSAAVPMPIIELALQALVMTILWCLTEPTAERLQRVARRKRGRTRKAQENAIRDELERNGMGDRFPAVMAAYDAEISAMPLADFAEILRVAQVGTADFD